jgi:hypothetical protein
MTKHTVGMIGVGKTMECWKMCSTPSCLRCGAIEDAAYVWICSDPAATNIWNESLEQLESWLHLVNTDPEISEAIMYHLCLWRSGTSITKKVMLSDILDKQSKIGFYNFITGWLSVEWELAQESYYNLIGSRRSGKDG